MSKINRNRMIFTLSTAVIFQLCFCLLPSFGLQAVLGVFILLVYFSPMMYNLVYIKNHEVGSIKQLIIADLIYQTAPSVIAAVFTECVIILCGAQPLPGLGSAVFALSAVIITALFWLMYLLYNFYYKPSSPKK